MDSYGDGKHPFFDDKRAVHWYRNLTDALAVAVESKRRVFICYGARTCGGTRALVERTIWKEEIAEYLNQHFVSVVAEPHGDAALDATVAALPKHEPTPVCLFLDGAGRVVHSTIGGRPPAVFLNEMMDAATRR